MAERNDKQLTTELTKIVPTRYRVTNPDLKLRAMLPEVLHAQARGSCNPVDVRSPDEFTDKVIASAGMTEPLEQRRDSDTCTRP